MQYDGISVKRLALTCSNALSIKTLATYDLIYNFDVSKSSEQILQDLSQMFFEVT